MVAVVFVRIDGATASIAAAALASAVVDVATYIPIAATHFDMAADFVRRCTAPLLAADSLQLAIAASRGATMWTLDIGMAKAGQALGLGTRLLAG